MFFLNLLPIPIILVLLIFIVRFRLSNNITGVRIVLPLADFFILIIALLSFLSIGYKLLFSIFVSAGLVFAIAADFFMADRGNNKCFLIALILYLAGLILYCVSIILYKKFSFKDIIVGSIILVIYIIGMIIIVRKMPQMKIPAAIYSFIFCFLVYCSISTIFENNFTILQSILLISGTVIYFVGDIILILHRSFNIGWINIVPVTYITGQILIALSTSYFKIK